MVAVQGEGEEGGELAVASARRQRLVIAKLGEIGEVSVLGEGGGNARLRNPARLTVAPGALDASEDAHVVGAIVDFAEVARVAVWIPLTVQDACAEDRACG